MLMSLILLLAIAVACALTLGRGAPAAQQARVPQPRSSNDQPTDDWQPGAITDARALRLAIAYSLDTTGGRVPVRVTL